MGGGVPDPALKHGHIPCPVAGTHSSEAGNTAPPEATNVLVMPGSFTCINI